MGINKPAVFGTLKLARLFWDTFLGQTVHLYPQKAYPQWLILRIMDSYSADSIKIQNKLYVYITIYNGL